MFRPNIKVK